jgi:hypothetical protein
MVPGYVNGAIAEVSGQRVLQIRQENCSVNIGTDEQVQARLHRTVTLFGLSVAVGLCRNLNRNDFDADEHDLVFNTRYSVPVTYVQATAIRRSRLDWEETDPPELFTRTSPALRGTIPVPLSPYQRRTATSELIKPGESSITVVDVGNNFATLQRELSRANRVNAHLPLVGRMIDMALSHDDAQL